MVWSDHILVKRYKGIGICFTSYIWLTAIHLMLQDFTFPVLACSPLSPHLPGEDTALLEPQLTILTRLLSHHCLIARCQFIYCSQIRGMKDLVGLEVARRELNPSLWHNSLVWQSTTKIQKAVLAQNGLSWSVALLPADISEPTWANTRGALMHHFPSVVCFHWTKIQSDQ